jgi:hypothetical protein
LAGRVRVALAMYCGREPGTAGTAQQVAAAHLVAYRKQRKAKGQVQDCGGLGKGGP